MTKSCPFETANAFKTFQDRHPLRPDQSLRRSSSGSLAKGRKGWGGLGPNPTPCYTDPIRSVRLRESEDMTIPPNDPRPGARFSHVYMKRGEPTEDSARMRHRIAAIILDIPVLHKGLKAEIEREIGVPAPYGTSLTALLRDMKLQDVLDLITVASNLLRSSYAAGPGVAIAWQSAVERIFREEHVHYQVEAGGGVRFYVDEEFARLRATAIAAMSQTRHANALEEFEKGMAALAKAPPDGKGGIRGLFAAAEGLFRLIVPLAPRLAATELNSLTPVLQRLYAGEDTALRSSQKMLTSFKGWVDAVHFYRHEEGAEEVAQPPLRLAIYIVSSGTAHLRWLAELDAQTQQQ